MYSNWNSENPVQSFRKATKDSMVKLMGWSKMEFRKRDKKIKEAKESAAGVKTKKGAI